MGIDSGFLEILEFVGSLRFSKFSRVREGNLRLFIETWGEYLEKIDLSHMQFPATTLQIAKKK